MRPHDMNMIFLLCRCTAPSSEFKKASMGRPPKIVAGAEGPIAAREHFKPRGTEHSFALNT